jgi:hypothetical protein
MGEKAGQANQSTFLPKGEFRVWLSTLPSQIHTIRRHQSSVRIKCIDDYYQLISIVLAKGYTVTAFSWMNLSRQKKSSILQIKFMTVTSVRALNHL